MITSVSTVPSLIPLRLRGALGRGVEGGNITWRRAALPPALQLFG
jgi:hypothetical protein